MPPRASTSRLEPDSGVGRRSARPASTAPAPPASNNQAHPRLILEVIYADYSIRPPFPSPYPFEDSAIAAATAPTRADLSSSASVKPHGNSRAAKAEKAKLAALGTGHPSPRASAPPTAVGTPIEQPPAGESAPTPPLGEKQSLAPPDSSLPSHAPPPATATLQAQQATLISGQQTAQGGVAVQGTAGAAVGGGGGATSAKGAKGGAKELKGKLTPRMFVCHGCFKYCLNEGGMNVHKRECSFKHPPGRKVYQRGAHIIWEVDGASAKLYCQNLCLFGKLFIEHKYQFFDLDGFLFYILTDATPSFDYPLAYFSKEKVSYDDYNLACIVTFPPFQKKNYGTLLIEFSYEVSRRGPTPGTPERPLSRLGLASYQAYWTGCLVSYLRQVFKLRAEPPLPARGGPKIKLTGRLSSAGAADGSPAGESEAERARKRQRKGGWAGEKMYRQAEVDQRSATPEESKPSTEPFELPTTLEELSKRVGLRIEDVAFAMVESGLAQWRREDDDSSIKGEEDPVGRRALQVLITPELVETVARERKVRPAIMEQAYVLL